LAWAIIVAVAPKWCLDLLGVAHLVSVPFVQALGMMVGVYGYGYWLMARDPVRYSGFIWIGLAGKLFGIGGFLFYASRGVLPWSLGATILPNDVIWIPVFVSFAWKFGRKND
jgi:hypothetical protein